MSDYTELTHELRMTHCSNEGLHDQAADAIVQLQADLAAARALLREANPLLLPSGDDLSLRIDDALAEGKK